MQEWNEELRRLRLQESGTSTNTVQSNPSHETAPYLVASAEDTMTFAIPEVKCGVPVQAMLGVAAKSIEEVWGMVIFD